MFHSVDFAAGTESAAATAAPIPFPGPGNSRDQAPARIAAEAPGLLRRPRILARAAREGARIYRRERDLTGALPGATGPRRGADIVSRLLGIEAQIEADRRAGAAAYGAQRRKLPIMRRPVA